MIFFMIILSVVSIVIMAQDFTTRAISWVSLPLVFVCILGLRWEHHTLVELLLRMVQNFIIVLAVIGLTCIHFYLREGKKKNPINKAIGMGDIGYFIAITPFCEPKAYLMTISFGSVAGLAWFALMYLAGSPPRSVPLAGVMAMIVITWQWCHFLGLEEYRLQQFFAS